MRSAASGRSTGVWGLVTALAIAGSIAVVAACSSSKPAAGPVACNVDPSQCGPGTTCWPDTCVCPAGVQCDASNCVPQFACIQSFASSREFDACHNTIGVASCSDNQACVEVSTGICLAYCDSSIPARNCPGGQTCTEFNVGHGTPSPTVHVCVRTGGGDGGALDAEANEVGLTDRDIPDVDLGVDRPN